MLALVDSFQGELIKYTFVQITLPLLKAPLPESEEAAADGVPQLIVVAFLEPFVVPVLPNKSSRELDEIVLIILLKFSLFLLSVLQGFALPFDTIGSSVRLSILSPPQAIFFEF
jgi:hypothetical protein